MLKRGDRGKEVRELQRKLQAAGMYYGTIDGDFGVRTEAAVRLFQCHHLSTGVVDSLTEIKLNHYALPRPTNRRELERTFGHIEYNERDNGWVTITNDFARENIIEVFLPIVGRRRIHRLIAPKIMTALHQIAESGYAGYIKTFGTLAYRHICNNPNKPLSTHCYGIAIDINARENMYGQRSCNIHPYVIEAFCGRGFVHGASWRTPDPMHFQYYGKVKPQ